MGYDPFSFGYLFRIFVDLVCPFLQILVSRIQEGPSLSGKVQVQSALVGRRREQAPAATTWLSFQLLTVSDVSKLLKILKNNRAPSQRSDLSR